jgi:chloramphenicol O-acetyltransferase type B
VWDRLAGEGIVSVGRETYGYEGIQVHEFRVPDGTWVGAKLRIGSYCSLAPFEVFLGGNHHTEWVSQFPFRSRWDLPGRADDGYGRGDVVLGSDVWIGTGALILSGVTIGHGAVVGARAVVTRDVRPYAVVAGNPAREVRRRFDDSTAEQLLADPWWDWPVEPVRTEWATLNAPPAGGGTTAGLS